MKIIIEGDANELAALVNDVNGTQSEPDTDEVIAAFKKMTLARIKQLETSTGQALRSKRRSSMRRRAARADCRETSLRSGD